MNEAKEQVPPTLPKGFPPELIPVYDWWVKEGKSTLAMVLAAALAVAGFYGVKGYLAKRAAAANAAFESAYTTDDLESAVADYGSTKLGPALKLRLAKSYYDAGRYEDALALYDALKGKDLATFGDVAAVGRGFALEGLKRYDEAEAAYADYVASSATNAYLMLTAKMAVARVVALKGKKDDALKDLDAMAKTATSFDKMRIERLTDAIKRYDPKKAERSLFDAANAAAAALDTEKKPAAAPAKPAVVPAAPAKPADKKPAEKK